MNKIILANLFLLFFICFGQQYSFAQQDNNHNIRPSTDGPVYNVVPVQKALEVQTPVNNPSQESNNKVVFTPSGQQKNSQPKKTDETAAEKTIQYTLPQHLTDKNGNPVPYHTQRIDKSKIGNSDLSDEKYQDNLMTYPDLQVTATQEEVIPVQNFGTERNPVPSSTEKKQNTTPTDQSTNTTTNTGIPDVSPKIGKVEFLKQYVEELKALIEKNKNVPNYPLEEKQKELEDLENLLKQE